MGSGTHSTRQGSSAPDLTGNFGVAAMCARLGPTMPFYSSYGGRSQTVFRLLPKLLRHWAFRNDSPRSFFSRNRDNFRNQTDTLSVLSSLSDLSSESYLALDESAPAQSIGLLVVRDFDRRFVRRSFQRQRLVVWSGLPCNSPIDERNPSSGLAASRWSKRIAVKLQR